MEKQNKKSDTMVQQERAVIVKVNEVENNREHAEFHNSYREEDIKADIRFLQAIYKNKIQISVDDVT